MRIFFFWYVFLFSFPKNSCVVDCFVYIGSISSNFIVDAGSELYFLRGFFFFSKEVEDMCQRYSWIELQFDGPSVLVPNAWFSLVPDFCWAACGRKIKQCWGFSLHRMTCQKLFCENLKPSSHRIKQSFIFASNLHFPPLVGRRHKVIFLLAADLVNFMTLLDLCFPC